jgi:hypothetical protein
MGACGRRRVPRRPPAALLAVRARSCCCCLGAVHMWSTTAALLVVGAVVVVAPVRAEEMRRRLKREYARETGAPGGGQDGDGLDLGGLDLGSLLGGGAMNGGAGGGGGGCPPGQVFAPRQGYRPQANGCGPAGMRQRDGDQYGLHECCNGHDTCYSACGTAFQYCEKEFKKCMLTKCKAATGQAGAGSHCVETANSFSGMTGMFGRSFHQQGMDEACECVPEDQATERNVDYFVHFYKTYVCTAGKPAYVPCARTASSAAPCATVLNTHLHDDVFRLALLLLAVITLPSWLSRRIPTGSSLANRTWQNMGWTLWKSLTF